MKESSQARKVLFNALLIYVVRAPNYYNNPFMSEKDQRNKIFRVLLKVSSLCQSCHLVNKKRDGTMYPKSYVASANISVNENFYLTVFEPST